MVGILAQAIDAAVGAQRELVLREELGAAGQRRQKAADLLQVAWLTPFCSIRRASSISCRTAAVRS